MKWKISLFSFQCVFKLYGMGLIISVSCIICYLQVNFKLMDFDNDYYGNIIHLFFANHI